MVFFHLFMIELLIRLSPQRVNGRTFGRIEHPALYKSFVRIDTHLASQSVDFSHQMPFPRTSY